MTGIERLRDWVGTMRLSGLVWAEEMADELESMADKIERETQPKRDPAAEDAEAVAWVREHGGLDAMVELSSRLMTVDALRAAIEEFIRHAGDFTAFTDVVCNRLAPELRYVEGCSKDVMDAALEALDRRLMPEGMEWPRFEDGEPVRVGDAFAYGDETFYVDSVQLLRREFHLWATNGRVVTGSNGERCERPAPKVLDADGAEIRVGDTVWATNGRGPFEVTRIVNADRLRVICNDEENGHLNVYPESITHRAPVLAADGRPLREGEHVYHVETGAELVVKKLPKPGEYQAVVVFAPPASHLMSFDPDQLTHERPDSWERLEEDAGNVAHLFDAFDEKASADIRDLVRRAKALAGRDAK